MSIDTFRLYPGPFSFPGSERQPVIQVMTCSNDELWACHDAGGDASDLMDLHTTTIFVKDKKSTRHGFILANKINAGERFDRYFFEIYARANGVRIAIGPEHLKGD